MKKVLALVLAGLLLSSIALAWQTVTVTFYDGDPAEGAEALRTVQVTDGAIGERIADIEDAEYVAIEVDGQRYVYEIIAGGSSKNVIRLNVAGVDLDDEDVDVAEVREDAPTLAEVIRELVAF